MDITTGNPVVMKLTPLKHLREEALPRLMQQAARLQAVHAPWLSPPLHCGQEGDSLYQVMPFIPGVLLAERLAQGRLPLKAALTVVRCLLAALRTAHEQGVPHLGLKPSNVVLAPGASGLEATLIHFGPSLGDLREGALRDVPLPALRYLAPEQTGLLDGEVGPASDLYAVGAILFECLTGAPRFQGTSLGELLRQHLSPGPRMHTLGLRVPRALEDMLQHLLRTDPRARYQCPIAVLEDLDALALALEQGVHEPALLIGRHGRRRVLTAPAFLERGKEVATLEGVLERTARGEGRLLLIEGMSGAGKTMLLDELARRGLSRGLRILRGQGLHRSAQRPFQVITGVAQGVLAAAEASPALAQALRSRLGESRETICKAVPELAGLLECASSRPPCPEQLAAVQTAKALAALFDALGEEGAPALVVLDDCQWADAQTLGLLSTWQQARAGEPSGGSYTSVVVAFRQEESQEGHPLRRLDAPAHLTVSPFEPFELHQLALSMAGPLPQEALNTVVQLAEGNPFMGEAIMRGLVETGALVPDARGWRIEPQRLAEASASRQAASLLLLRLRALPEQTQRLLVAGALLGREFELERAALLAELPAQWATEAVKEARQHHILWANPKGHYTFMHDRLREALLAQLPPEEARALHALAAQELERRNPDRVFDLAYHFDAADQPERALPYSLRAAEQARQQNALELAEHHYHLAERGAAHADPSTRGRIAEGLGDMQMLQGAYDAADQSFQQALKYAGSPLDQARIECKRGERAFNQWDTQQAPRIFERALRLLGHRVPTHPFFRALSVLWECLVQAWHTWRPRREPRASRDSMKAESTRLAVHLYHWLSKAYHIQAPCWGAVWASLRELNLAERHCSLMELARARAAHGTLLHLMLPHAAPRFATLLTSLFLERGRRYFRQGMELFMRLDEPWRQGQVMSDYAQALLLSAQFADSAEFSRQAAERLGRMGDRGHTLRMGWTLGLALYYQGNLPGAAEAGRRLLHEARELDNPVLIGMGLHVLALATEGDLPREHLTQEFARSSRIDRHFSLLHLAEGLRLLYTAMPGQAAASFEHADRQWKARAWQGPILWRATALRQQALQVPSSAPARRTALLRRAHHSVRQALRFSGPRQCNRPYALREEGWLAALKGKESLARKCFDRSLTLAEHLGMKYERALTLLARAEVGATLGWPHAAADAAAAEESLRAMGSRLASRKPPETAASLSLVDRFPRLMEAGRSIASALTREAVLDALKQAALELLRAEEVKLLEAEVSVQEGPEAPCRAAARYALETGRPAVLPVEQLEALAGGEPGSALGVPLRVRGERVAVLCATHRQLPGLFGEEELRIAEFLATLAGAALENARGFAEVLALSEERERLYQQAQAALRKRDEFLAVASHELRTPLTPLKLHLQGLVHSLRRSLPDAMPERWAVKLEAANARVQRFARLVEDLFDFSRLQENRLPLRRESVDLSALATHAVERWREELERVGCDCSLRVPGAVVGNWDGLRLEQVLDNLLSNALKYGPGRPIHVSVEAEGGHARLQVRDFGMGIVPEDQARIFERFERAVSAENYGGFGLGLWISREVVHAHGGRIHVRSAPGAGALFQVELPLDAHLA
jgi:signal transduction histidine kinase/tetratricopeptide (TPR) repeat protein